MQFKFPWQQYRKPQLPRTNLPHQQETQNLQRQFFITFVILLLFSGWYSFRFIQHQKNLEDLVPVLVAKETVKSPQLVTQTLFKTSQIPRRYLPDQVFSDLESVQGFILVRDLQPNEVLVPSHLREGISKQSISHKIEGQYALSLDESWLVAKLPALKPQDRIDIMTTNPKVYNSTNLIAQNLRVLQSIKGKNGKRTLLLEVETAQAEAILYARGLRLPMQILLKSLPQSHDTDSQ